MTLCKICLWPIPRTRKKKTMRDSRALCRLCLAKIAHVKAHKKYSDECERRYTLNNNIRAAREVAK